MTISDFVRKFEQSCGVVYSESSEKQIVSVPDDLDFIAPVGSKQQIISFLETNEAIVIGKSNYKINAYVVISSEIYLLDVALDIQYLSLIFNKIRLTSALQNRIIKDLRWLDFLQCIMFLRGESRHHDRINAGYEKYIQYFFDEQYIKPNLFRKKNISKEELHKFINRELGTLVRVIKIRHLVSLVMYSVKRRLKIRRRGQSVGIIGVDGAGKSTIINILSNLPRTRVIYMGDGNFAGQTLYKYLQLWFGRWGKQFSYVLQYGEVWGRFFQIKFLQWCGYTVITDRWPGFNRHLILNQKKFRISQFLFSLIPPPNKLLFLNANPEVIHARKQELSVSDIHEYQQAISEKLKNRRNTYQVKNIAMDSTIRTILKYLYETN